MTNTTTTTTAIPARLSASSCSFEDYISIGHPAGSSSNSNSGETVIKPILAERYKTKFCRNYMETGVCPYQSRCMFAHGEYELRTADMNMCDGLVTEEAIRAFRRQWRRAATFQPQYNNNNNINNMNMNINNDFQGEYINGEDYSTPIPIPNGDRRGRNNNNTHNLNNINNNNNNNNANMYYSYPQKHIPASAAADNTISQYEYGYYYNNNDYYNYYNDNNINIDDNAMYVPYVYTHNPYAYNLLPPESRLYSQLPALLPTPQEEENEENQQELCNALNHTDVMNGDDDINTTTNNNNTTAITTEPRPGQSLLVKTEEEENTKEVNNNNNNIKEDAELSACSYSSIGSESAEIQQLSPETKYRSSEDQNAGEMEQKNVC